MHKRYDDAPIKQYSYVYISLKYNFKGKYIAYNTMQYVLKHTLEWFNQESSKIPRIGKGVNCHLALL